MVANGLHPMASASVSCNDCVIALRLRAGIVGERLRPRAALGTGNFRPVAVARKGALERLDKGFAPQKHLVLYLFPGGRLIDPRRRQSAGNSGPPLLRWCRMLPIARPAATNPGNPPHRRWPDNCSMTTRWRCAPSGYAVPGQLQQIAVFLNNDCRVGALEDMSVALVEVVEALRVDPVEVPHPLGQIAVRCRDQEMVVIRHQAEGMDPPVDPFTHLRQ